VPYSDGWILAFPSQPDKQTKWRVALFNGSGVVADLICAAVAFVVLIAVPRSPVLMAFVIPTAILSLVVAAASLQTIYRYIPLSRFGVARLKATGLSASGVMPGQLDAVLVAALEAGAEHRGGETEADLRSADIFLYEHYFDLGEYKRARTALDRAGSRTSPSDKIWYGLCIENAFFSAFIERDIARAEEALAKVNDTKRRRHYPYRQALAAIAIARGDGAEALRVLGRRPRDISPFSRLYGQKVHTQVVREAQRLMSSQ
jgi:hypothetical protein